MKYLEDFIDEKWDAYLEIHPPIRTIGDRIRDIATGVCAGLVVIGGCGFTYNCNDVDVSMAFVIPLAIGLVGVHGLHFDDGGLHKNPNPLHNSHTQEEYNELNKKIIALAKQEYQMVQKNKQREK